jgi:hypothetical protein
MRKIQMQRIMVATFCAALSMAPGGGARGQDLQETLGRVLQGFQGQSQSQGQGQGQDQRYDPRDPRYDRAAPERREGDRRYIYSDRSDPQDRLRALDEADRRLDAQQRQLDEDRRRIEAERRRLTR